MEGTALSILRAFNPSLLASGAAVLIFAALACLLARSTPPGRRLLNRLSASEKLLPRAAFVLALVYVAVYSWLSIHRYHKLMTWSWDLGIFESLMANALHGRFFVDYRGPFDHFDPAVFLYLPFYAAWRDPRMLLVAQTAVLAAAAWPLYLLAREVSGAKSLGALAAIAYLLYPMLGSANLHDFHAVSLTPLFFFSALLFAERRRWGLYWVFVVLLLGVKETEAILVFAMGLYLLWRKRHLQGALSAALALAWVAASLWLVIPWMMGEEYRHFRFFGGVAETAQWVIQPDGSMAAVILRRIAQSAAVLFFALAPAAFLPARRWRTLLFIFMPVIGIYLLSNNWPLRTVSGHYGLPVTAAALGAMALALRGIHTGRAPRPRTLTLFVLLVAVLCNLVYSYPAHRRWAYPSVLFKRNDAPKVLSMPAPLDAERRAFYRLTPHERFFHAAKEAVPPGAKVAAQRNLAAFFAVGYELHDLGPDARADYYLFDLAGGYGTNTENYRRFIAALEADREMVRFLTLTENDTTTFVFFARGAGWIDFHARAEAQAATGNPYSRAVVQAVERTLGLGGAAAKMHAPSGDAAGGAGHPDER